MVLYSFSVFKEYSEQVQMIESVHPVCRRGIHSNIW